MLEYTHSAMEDSLKAELLKLGASIAPHIFSLLTNAIGTLNLKDKQKISSAIELHLIEVINWATIDQIFGVTAPQGTDKYTIALELSTEPRRFQSPGKAKTKHENDILSDPNNCLLLGEPGSGKTTIVKRLALTMLRKPPKNEHDIYQYPLVIRLRELQEKESLISKIADNFGITIEERIITTERQTHDLLGKTTTEKVNHVEYHVSNHNVIDAVAAFLNDSKALLFLDGLDEVGNERIQDTRSEIIDLSRKLNTSKIVVSLRSGNYVQAMEGFSVLEICPLSEGQIVAIKDRWLGKIDTKFMDNLRALPYYDVANRPLLLVQLLILFRRYGYLPDQPSSVYRKLVNLLLEEWDAQRTIKRPSKYAGFDPDKKAEFLQCIAYQLMFRLGKVSFSEIDLLKVFRSIYEQFRLPENEAPEVVREIMTHTGIIMLGAIDLYEFCHLSLQEYLCAEYLVRAPILEHALEFMATNKPAPLAVAVALSSEPSDWFSKLILPIINERRVSEENLSSFLSRVLIERPRFEKSELLGCAMFALFRRVATYPSILPYLNDLVKIHTIFDSMGVALKYYTTSVDQQPEFVGLVYSQRQEPTYGNIPALGAIPKDIIDQLLKSGVRLHDRDT
jgi:hypothetical protein